MSGVPASNRCGAFLNSVFCVVEMIHDANGEPADHRFAETTPAFEKHTGLHQARGSTIREMVPDYDAHEFEIYGKVDSHQTTIVTRH